MTGGSGIGACSHPCGGVETRGTVVAIEIRAGLSHLPGAD
jgi:hypothetical protein